MVSPVKADTVDAFNGLAAIYDRSRPLYPPECLNVLESRLPFPRGSNTGLDVGCGTGILTRQLAAHFALFDKIVGIDVNPEMLKQAAIRTTDTRVRYEAIPAENIGKHPAGPFAFIIAASAANWFDRPKFYSGASASMIAGGILAFLINRRRFDSDAFLSELEDYLETSVPGYARGRYSSAVGEYSETGCFQEELIDAPNFVDIEEHRVERLISMPNSDATDYFLSFNDLKRASKMKGQARVRRDLSDLVSRHFGESELVQFPVTAIMTSARYSAVCAG